MIPNPALGFSPEYFRTVLREYQEWYLKWWREAIQNSVDAGASRIVCGVESLNAEQKLVYVEDDGSGMDEDTLFGAFLMLGGTTKRGEGKTGGFGKAKELLILPWEAWSIETRGIRVHGSGVEYDVERLSSPRKGTRLEVVMRRDEELQLYHAHAVLERSNIPGVRFVLRDDEGERTVRARFGVRKLVESFRGADLYVRKPLGEKAEELYVRVNGLWMFSVWVPDIGKKQPVLEITGPSYEYLTANRDGLRDYSLRRQVEMKIAEISADVKSALRVKSRQVRERFSGTIISTQAVSATIRTYAFSGMDVELVPKVEKDGTTFELDKNTVETFASNLEWSKRSVEDVMDSNDLSVAARVPNAEAMAFALSSVTYDSERSAREAMQLYSWMPEYYLLNELDDFRVPRMFYPDTMTPNVRKLLAVWTEFCRFVLLQLHFNGEFGVGFMFSYDMLAAYFREDGLHWLMLNPYRDLLRLKGLLRVSNMDDLASIYASAVHECTHMTSGISTHTEAFSSAMTANVAKTLPGARKIRALARYAVKTI